MYNLASALLAVYVKKQSSNRAIKINYVFKKKRKKGRMNLYEVTVL